MLMTNWILHSPRRRKVSSATHLVSSSLSLDGGGERRKLQRRRRQSRENFNVSRKVPFWSLLLSSPFNFPFFHASPNNFQSPQHIWFEFEFHTACRALLSCRRKEFSLPDKAAQKKSRKSAKRHREMPRTQFPFTRGEGKISHFLADWLLCLEWKHCEKMKFLSLRRRNTSCKHTPVPLARPIVKLRQVHHEDYQLV